MEPCKTVSLKDQDLTNHINNSPLVLAAITESVHRYFHDNCLGKKIDVTDASNLLSCLWNLNPNWRQIIKDHSEKYRAENTNAVPSDGKPDVNYLFNIHITESNGFK